MARALTPPPGEHTWRRAPLKVWAPRRGGPRSPPPLQPATQVLAPCCPVDTNRVVGTVGYRDLPCVAQPLAAARRARTAAAATTRAASTAAAAGTAATTASHERQRQRRGAPAPATPPATTPHTPMQRCPAAPVTNTYIYLQQSASNTTRASGATLPSFPLLPRSALNLDLLGCAVPALQVRWGKGGVCKHPEYRCAGRRAARSQAGQKLQQRVRVCVLQPAPRQQHLSPPGGWEGKSQGDSLSEQARHRGARK